ncbi:MAG TPA: type VI secretion system-associated FHA domain protein TagH [Alphaproteobacteria bacterium]|nr:type VI secretion system-associated FHA domain protein TagH [Alphaproteobacteria bacterium]
MALTLALVSKEPLPPGQSAAKRVDRSALTVGRGKENDWVLHDPQRFLSSRHCAIEFKSGQYYVADMSTNGVFFNDATEPLGRGNSALLHDGDRLRLGQYVIQVRITQDDVVDEDPLERPAEDSLARMLRGAPDYPGAASARDAASGEAASSWEEDGAGEANPFAAEPSGHAGIPARPHAEHGAALIPDDADLFGSDAGKDEWHGRSESDHVPSEQVFFAPPRARRDVIPDDWNKELVKASPATPAARQAPAADAGVTRESRAAALPDAAPAPAPTSADALAGDAAHAGTTPAGAPEALALRLFLEAAGMAELKIPDAAAADTLRMLGRLFHTAVRGMRAALLARAAFKSEFRVEQTLIKPTENNPLKFSVTDEEAMAALLRPAVRGYLPGERAFEEALGDIEAHQLALLAGLQAALAALLKKFDPKNLELQLKQSSLLANVLPGARKAMYWDVFINLYGEIARAAEDDFHGFLGRDFARAYKEQTKKG